MRSGKEGSEDDSFNGRARLRPSRIILRTSPPHPALSRRERERSATRREHRAGGERRQGQSGFVGGAGGFVAVEVVGAGEVFAVGAGGEKEGAVGGGHA